MARVNQVQIDEAIANFQYEGILVEERPYETDILTIHFF